MRPLRRALALALLASGSSALRSQLLQPGPGARAFRQRLDNSQDLQYFGDFLVGGQTLRGVVDTGSYELVVFSRGCTSCGLAALYDEGASGSFVKGRRRHEHSYGSGTCQTQDGRDEVTVGPLWVANQSLWEAVECRMPLLQQAGFSAIVGVGPPGQPSVSAERLLEQLRATEAEYRKANRPFPEEARQAMANAQQDIDDAPGKRSLLEGLGVSAFSACFGRAPGSPAWLVWNDARPDERQGAVRAAVVGKVSWGVRLGGVGLAVDGGETRALGCQDGCGAVLDTGTSLLGVPTEVYDAVREFVIENNNDCSDLSRFPPLVLSIDGQEVHLPADSYVGGMVGKPSTDVRGLVRTDRLGGEVGCQLLLLDLGTELTQFGPMVIIGMPFFRQFYTTFDLGAGPGNRSLYFSLADEQCRPAQQGHAGVSSLRRSRGPVQPRVVDVSRLQAPHWLRNRRSTDL